MRRTVLASFLLMAVLASAVLPSFGADDMTLIKAAGSGDLATVKAEVADGARLEARDSALRTPLLIATRANHVEVAAALIGAGADVNARDNIRDTPFLYAGAEGRNEILRLILATGRAKLGDTNRYGGTALIPAAHHGHPETVAILLEAGLDVDHVNDLGWTALMEAVILGDGGETYRRIVEILVAAGARDIPDRDGRTALEHARQRGFGEMAEIIARGAAPR